MLDSRKILTNLQMYSSALKADKLATDVLYDTESLNLDFDT